MRSKAERAALYSRRAKGLRRLAKTTAGDAITEGMLLSLAADYENLARMLDDSTFHITPARSPGGDSRSSETSRLG